MNPNITSYGHYRNDLLIRNVSSNKQLDALKNRVKTHPERFKELFNTATFQKILAAVQQYKNNGAKGNLIDNDGKISSTNISYIDYIKNTPLATEFIKCDRKGLFLSFDQEKAAAKLLHLFAISGYSKKLQTTKPVFNGCKNGIIQHYIMPYLTTQENLTLLRGRIKSINNRQMASAIKAHLEKINEENEAAIAAQLTNKHYPPAGLETYRNNFWRQLDGILIRDKLLLDSANSLDAIDLRIENESNYLYINVTSKEGGIYRYACQIEDYEITSSKYPKSLVEDGDNKVVGCEIHPLISDNKSLSNLCMVEIMHVRYQNHKIKIMVNQDMTIPQLEKNFINNKYCNIGLVGIGIVGIGECNKNTLDKTLKLSEIFNKINPYKPTSTTINALPKIFYSRKGGNG